MSAGDVQIPELNTTCSIPGFRHCNIPQIKIHGQSLGTAHTTTVFKREISKTGPWKVSHSMGTMNPTKRYSYWIKCKSLVSKSANLIPQLSEHHNHGNAHLSSLNCKLGSLGIMYFKYHPAMKFQSFMIMEGVKQAGMDNTKWEDSLLLLTVRLSRIPLL